MGGKSNQSTSSNAPPAQYLQAYQNVLNRAQGVANTPYQAYPGQVAATQQPLQTLGFETLGGLTQGPGNQYINQAQANFQNANAPLAPQIAPYVGAAGQYYQNAANANLQGSIAPWQKQAAQGFNAGSQTLTPTQYSGAAVNQYMSPYVQDVVNATQNQFNNQNAQAQAGLRGNAASANALGGDRLGVAQGVLAGQQQTAQAPVIAGLYNQGFGQAQGEFNTQQQTNLTAQQQSEALKQQAAQGFAGLGQQSLTAAQQQAALQAQAGQGYAGLGQEMLGAGQAQGWLAAQTGAGEAGLGSQVTNQQIATANALLGGGAQQQQLQQQQLNVPYQQWQAQVAYPYQQTSWLSNIAQGLGGSSGGTSTTTTPGPSAASQIGGLGLAGLGIYGATGGFSGGSSLFNSAPTYDYGTWARGGAIKGFAGGGGVPPDVSVNTFGSPSGAPGIMGPISSSVPDASMSVIPGAGTGGGFNVPSGGGGGSPYMKRNFGTTTTSRQPSGLGSLLGLGTAIATGNPMAGFAVSAGSNSLGLDRGGYVPIVRRGFGGQTPIRGFADGGDLFPDQGLDQPMVPDQSDNPNLDFGRNYIPQDIGNSAPADDETLPIPPIPPAHRAGFAAAPRRVPQGQGPLPIPPPPQVADQQQPGGPQRPPPMRDPFEDFLGEQMKGSRAMTEERASPWLALASAGFGMAAGQSPHALENIGAGGLQGVRQYVAADQAAKDLHAKVLENMARLGEAQAYHEATINQRTYGIDTRAQTSKDRNDAMQNLAMMRMAAAAERSGSHATPGDILSGVMGSLVGQTNPDTGQPYTKLEAYHAANGFTQRMAQGDQRLAQGDARVQAMQDHNQWLKDHASATDAQKQANWETTQQRYAAGQDFQALRSLTDPLGLKPKPTADQAHALADQIRAANAPTGTSTHSALPAAQTEGLKVGDVQDGYRFVGGDPADQRSWAPQ